MSANFTLEFSRDGSTWHAVVIETDSGQRREPVAFTRDTVPAAAEKLAGMMPGANVAEIGEALLAEIERVPTPNIIGVAELVRNFPDLKPPVIHGLLRETEVANIIAPSKRAKSWLAMSIAFAVASGRTIFERFPVERGQVLLIDNELHPNTLAKRIPDVAQAMGIVTQSELADWIGFDSLRGRLCDLYAMETYFRSLEPGRFKLIVLDALYRFLPRDHDENSNAQTTILYNTLDRYAAMTGAAFLIVHHASKGLQTGKSVTDVGSGAGAMSRAADAHLILRDHEQDGAVVMEAAVRSWPPSDPICLRWDWPLWRVAPELDPTQLRQAKSRQERPRKPEAAPEPEAKTWTPANFVAAFIGADAKRKSLILAKARQAEISEREALGLIELAEDEGLIFRHPAADPKDKNTYYANREPMLADYGQDACVSRAHSPPHPPSNGNVAGAAGCASVNGRRKRGAK